MKVRELLKDCEALISMGQGDAEIFVSSDDEGNEFRPMDSISLYTVVEMEQEDMWIEEPRPDDADHVVIW